MKLPVSRTALLSTLVYAGLALLWLWLIAGMLADVGALGRAAEGYLVWAGGGFVLITAVGLYHLIRALLRDQKTIQAARRYTRASRLWLLGIVVMLLTVLTAQTLIISLVGNQLGPVLQQAGQTALIDRTRAQAEQLRLWTVRRDQQVIQLLDQKPLLQQQMQRVVVQTEPDLPALLKRAFRTGLFDEIVLYDQNYNPRAQHGVQSGATIEPRVFSRAVLTGDAQTQILWQQASSAIALFWVIAVYPDAQGVQSGPWFLVLRSELNSKALVVEQQNPGSGHWLIGGFVDGLDGLSKAGLAQGMQLNLDAPGALIAPLDQTRAAPLQQHLLVRNQTDHGRLAARGSVSRDFSTVSRAHADSAEVFTGTLNTADRLAVQIAFTPIERLGSIYWQQIENQSLIAPLKPVQHSLLLASVAAIVGMLAALWFVWRFQRLRQWYQLQAVSAYAGQSSLDWQNSPWASLYLQGDSLLIQKANLRAASLLCQSPERLVNQPFSAVFTPKTAFDRQQISRLRDRRINTAGCWLQAVNLQGLFRAEIRLITSEQPRSTRFLIQLTHAKSNAAVTTVVSAIERFLCDHGVDDDSDPIQSKDHCSSLTRLKDTPFEKIVLIKPGVGEQVLNDLFAKPQPASAYHALAQVRQSGQFIQLEINDRRYWLLPKTTGGLPTEEVFIVQLNSAWKARLPDLPTGINAVDQHSIIGVMLTKLQQTLQDEWAHKTRTG